MELKVIGHIHTDFSSKFGVPRQSGLVPELQACIQMEPPYRDREAFRGLEGCSHIWLIWQFSEAVRPDWSPTVRPPRLGGEKRMGVFATRSPFRPNPIGLSSVRLERIEFDPSRGPLLYISGADLMDNTPIYDIKPYLSYTDSHSEATLAYLDAPAVSPAATDLPVSCPPALSAKLPAEKLAALYAVLRQDPRPRFQHDPSRIYGMDFAGFNILFSISASTITIHSIEPLS